MLSANENEHIRLLTVIASNLEELNKTMAGIARAYIHGNQGYTRLYEGVTYTQT